MSGASKVNPWFELNATDARAVEDPFVRPAAVQSRVVEGNRGSYALGATAGVLAIVLLAIAAAGALLSPDFAKARNAWLGVAAGVALILWAAWLDRSEAKKPSPRHLIDGTGVFAAAGVLGLSILYALTRPANGGPFAAALVALLPISLWPWLRLNHSRRRVRTASVISTVALGVGLIVLALTGERTAWLSLVAGALVALVVLWLSARGHGRLAAAVIIVLLIGVVAVMAALLMQPSLLPAVVVASLPGELADRVATWRDALPLIGDYRFTGSGLGATEMVFASYALLTHVPYVAQVHNLYLQTALEMGVPGLIVLVGLLGVALAAAMQILRHGVRRTQGVAAAVVAALLASVILGMVDAEARSGPFVTALLAPVAAAIVAHAAARQDARREGAVRFPPPRPRGVVRRGAWALRIAASVVVVGLVVGFALLDRWQAAWFANLAAVRESQVELTDYAQAAWPFQDAIRREKAAELSPVEATFNQALALNAVNETAHRRLGQVALSLGQMTSAMDHLSEAHRLDPDNRVSALLLGEVLALRGDAEGAAGLWKPLTLEHNQLETRINWYRGLGNPDDIARMEQAEAVYLKDDAQ